MFFIFSGPLPFHDFLAPPAVIVDSTSQCKRRCYPTIIQCQQAQGVSFSRAIPANETFSDGIIPDDAPIVCFDADNFWDDFTDIDQLPTDQERSET